MSDGKIVWESLLDGRFACQVRRLDSAPDELALLVVMDGPTGVLVLSETVPLYYGAQFGPDVADVAEWQDKAVAAVESYLLKQEEPEP